MSSFWSNVHAFEAMGFSRADAIREVQDTTHPNGVTRSQSLVFEAQHCNPDAEEASEQAYAYLFRCG